MSTFGSAMIFTAVLSLCGLEWTSWQFWVLSFAGFVVHTIPASTWGRKNEATRAMEAKSGV